MKRTITALLVISAFAGSTTAPATARALDYTITTNNGAITISGYIGPGRDVTIPSTINGLPVITIGEDAFENCGNLTNVTIPDSITNIGEGAFNYCTNLTNVAIPDSVTNIGEGAFFSCRSLTSVTIPDSVTNIGEIAFNYTPSLMSLTVNPNNPTYSSLGGTLFNKNKTILIQYPGGISGGYTILDSVTSIGKLAFNYCTNLTRVTISGSVTNISELAFLRCKSLTNVTIPDSVTNIGEGAFFSCKSLTSVTIPDSVTNIGEEAFSDCTSLASLTVNPNNPTHSSLDGVLFNQDQTILIQYPAGKSSSYTIPNSVASIGTAAFGGCTSLTAVTIPDSVANIGEWAFSACTNLKEVYFLGDEPTLGEDVFRDCNNATIYYKPRTTGWGKTFGGRPTKPREPQTENKKSRTI